MSTFTPSKNLEQVARGADVGVWDTPTNTNWAVMDGATGGLSVISLGISNIILSISQFQTTRLTFNSTLGANVQITFPTSFTGAYTIDNACTGSSAFTITLLTTAAGGQAICCPPRTIFDCWNDGVNLKYRNLGLVGSYWDYAGSSVPNWVTGCTLAPYLNCDGSAFSAGNFPALAIALNGTTLPDLRGRIRGYLNQGTGRMTAGSGGVDGNTLTAGGGADAHAIAQGHIPNYNLAVTDPTHSHGPSGGGGFTTAPGAVNFGPGGATNLNPSNSMAAAATGISVNSAGANVPFPTMPPTAIGGITMIRTG